MESGETKSETQTEKNFRGPQLLVIAALGFVAVAAALGRANRHWFSGPFAKTELNSVLSLSAVKQGEMVRVEIATVSRPRYEVLSVPPTQILLKLKDTAISAPKRLTLAECNVVEVRAEQKRGELSPAVLVSVMMKRPAEYSLAVEADTLLALEIKEPAESPPFSEDDFTGPRRVVMDLHSDILTKLYKAGSIQPFSQTAFQVTLPNLKAGGFNGQVFVVWVPPSKGFHHAQLLLNIFDRLMEAHAAEIAPAASTEDFKKNLAAGKISAFLGIEGGEAIGHDLANLDYFYVKGVRYMGLVWNNSNLLGDAALDRDRLYHGLSPFGKEVVKRMNQLGMLIDVSHATPETVADILELSEDPVINSHTACYSLRPHERNMRDGQIRQLCEKGGVIGVIFSSNFLKGRRTTYPDDVVDHIDHIVRFGGIRCAALGSDYDGGVNPPVGLRDPSGIANLTRALLRRGYSPAEIDLIYGLNFLRVLHQVTEKK